MSRSPSPSTSSSIPSHTTLQPPSGRSIGIVLLSPRQSPTPEPPAALPAVESDETATPPPPPSQAAPPTDSLAHGTVDGGRDLVREIARSEGGGGRGIEPPEGAYYNEDGHLFPHPPPPDPALLTARPEDLVAAWEDDMFGSTIRGEPFLPPPIPAINREEEEEEDQEALFSSSLDAGEEALLRRRRSRRRIIRDSPPPSDSEAEGGGRAGVSGMDLLTEDTGWVFIPSESGPEISPEEERARRMAAESSASAAVEGRWDDSAWAAEYIRQAEREMNEGREEGASLWRNDPLSIPRTSALPRGGRFYPSGSTFSPSNPPSYDRNPATRIVGTHVDFIAGDGAPPSRRTVPDADDEDEDEDDLLLRPYFRAPTRTPPPATTTSTVGGVPPASLSIFHSPPRPRAPVGDPSISNSNFTSAFTSSILHNPLQTGPRRRTREETNALMGHALRAKKGVYLLYCGGGGGDGREGEEALPPGFSYASKDGEEEGPRKGCGALLCARALLDGVPGKIFTDEDARSGNGKERAAASSDLPPSVARVTDWDASGRVEGDGGERVGKRGWRGCKGCVTRDVGCKRCGNHLGYRLLRPCVTCSIARPSYTSYANVVSSTSSSIDPPRSPGGSSLTMTAGGVTGGGVVDGLLFHFRLDAVTSLQRLVGVQPEEELEGEKRARKVAGKRRALDEVEEEARERASPGRRGAGVGVGRRLVEKVPGVGEGMLWRNVPSAQRDFLDNLLGEPSDWITPSGETWWLENAVAKHTQRGSGYGYGGGAAGGGRKRRAEESGFGVDGHSSDRLSTATTTIDASTGTSSLSRSGAIRHRIPLASSSSSSSSPSGPTYPSISLSTSHPVGTGAVDEYDRFRADASDFSRRVRQRLADPAGEEGVVRGLERAGYGSGFGTEEDEGEGEELQAGLRRRTTGRERRRRESVGR